MADPAWLQLTLQAERHEPQQLEDALLAAGALAVTLADEGDQPVLEPPPGETPLWSRTRVTGLFEAQTDIGAVKYRLSRALGPEVLAEARLEGLEERDWTRTWLEDFQPLQFGRRLWVCPSGSTPPDPGAVNLWLDPGLAFGTGTHPTTALCLEWLDGAELSGKRVIDYGCGSGILAIAAARLGAAEVQATDIDPQALLACDQNADRNQVGQQVTTLMPEALAPAPVDLLLANILAGPLIGLAPRFSERIVPGGDLVLSGLLRTQTDEVQAAFTPWFTFAEPRQRDEWVLLHGRRRDEA